MKQLLRFALVLSLTSVSLYAQSIGVGSIVRLTGPSGKRLTAAPGQGLYLADSAWAYDEWQVADNTLISHHGTNLTFTYSGTTKAVHAPHLPGDGIALSGVEGILTGKAIVNGGKVVLYGSDARTPQIINALQDTNGTVAIGRPSGLSSIPAEMTWTISIVPSPTPDRSPRRYAATGGFEGHLQSYHQTWMVASLNTDVLTHSPQRGISVYIRANYESGPNPAPLLFGEDVLIFQPSSEGYWVVVQGGGPDENGFETATFKRLTDVSGPTQQWTIMKASGTPYSVGDRVPRDVPVLLRASSGKYLSAAPLPPLPAVPRLRLNTSYANYETWKLISK